MNIETWKSTRWILEIEQSLQRNKKKSFLFLSWLNKRCLHRYIFMYIYIIHTYILIYKFFSDKLLGLVIKCYNTNFIWKDEFFPLFDCYSSQSSQHFIFIFRLCYSQVISKSNHLAKMSSSVIRKIKIDVPPAPLGEGGYESSRRCKPSKGVKLLSYDELTLWAMFYATHSDQMNTTYIHCSIWRLNKK